MRTIILLFGLIVLYIGVATAQPDATPETNRYANLPQAVDARGLPQLGFPNALVELELYAAFDDLESGAFYAETFDALVNRARGGEVRITFVPLHGAGTISGGRGAARGALCAAEQGAFWPFHDVLFQNQAAYGSEALASGRLLAISGDPRLALDTNAWNACMATDAPDRVLDAAALLAASQPSFTQTPYVLVGGVPVLPSANDISAAIDLEVARVSATLQAEVAAAEAQPDVTADPNATEEATPIVVTVEPLMGDQVAPPLTLDLPEGWQVGYDTLLLQDIDAIRNMPFAVYQGPVTGGTGTIVLLWGFPNLVQGNPLAGTLEYNLVADGTRLLRLAIVETGCNIGTDLRRTYSVGGLEAVGTQFAAVDCPELNDTRGWFAGLRQFNLNFIFYVFAEPIEALDGAATGELQAILDTVQFVIPEVTPEATGEVTPDAAP